MADPGSPDLRHHPARWRAGARQQPDSPEEKLRLARQLDALGVDIIEAGFPAASEGDYRSVREIAAEIRRPGASPPWPAATTGTSTWPARR